MLYNKLYADSFKYGLMFGKDIRPGEIVKTSVVNKEDVILAVKKAYIDMTPRTFTSKNPDDKKQINSDDKEKLFLQMANKFIEYMKGKVNLSRFDEWHEGFCEFFIYGDKQTKGFMQILLDANKDKSEATYGKAQKIINMTFKYLYCFDDAKEYINLFAPCHMALDRYILNWFFDWYKSKWGKDNKGMKLSKHGKYHLPIWSDLKYRKESHEFIPQYIEIQNEIKELLSLYDVTRLEAEFVIWYESRHNIKYSYFC